MVRWIIILCVLLTTQIARAHQAEVSTTMLVETEEGKWLLQITAALTAFQYEVKANFPETTYASPEEFQDLVLRHMRKNILIYFDQQDTLKLEKSFVKLGHETKVVFEVSGVPEIFNSAYVSNTSFKDIHRSQSALVFLKKGFSQKQIVLNTANGHAVELITNGSKIELREEKNAALLPTLVILIIGVLVMGGGSLLYLLKNIKKRELVVAQ